MANGFVVGVFVIFLFLCKVLLELFIDDESVTLLDIEEVK